MREALLFAGIASAAATYREMRMDRCERRLKKQHEKSEGAYFEELAAIFLTMASTSLRSDSLRLGE